MEFDIFFSISQTRVDGYMPDEATMFRNWMEQVEAADRLGFGVAWLAESHLSSEVQKHNPNPVIPHWEGEVGLNCDFLQSAQVIFQHTASLAQAELDQHQGSRKAPGPIQHGRIEAGSAVMNILQGGGPIAAAERIAFYATLASLDDRPGGMQYKSDGSRRRIHVGFSAGRFDYMNRAYGIVPRNDLERAVPYPFLKGKIFDEATEIFCRLLAGQTLGSDDVPARTITEAECRSAEDWARIRSAGKHAGRIEVRPMDPRIRAALEAQGRPVPDVEDDVEQVVLPKRFVFDPLKIVPQDWPRGLVQLVAGSHDLAIPALANRYLPCQVANLSITPPHVIEATHRFMARIYHKDGGPWKRGYMPRTVMVFLNEEPGYTPAQRTVAAQAEARKALKAYWNALTGTIDPQRIQNAADNAVIGNAEEVARQVAQRFHPEDRLMLWFDFFNHDSARVIRNMEAWMEQVVPRIPAAREEMGQEVET